MQESLMKASPLLYFQSLFPSHCHSGFKRSCTALGNMLKRGEKKSNSSHWLIYTGEAAGGTRHGDGSYADAPGSDEARVSPRNNGRVHVTARGAWNLGWVTE